MFLVDALKRYPRPIATTITAASAAAVQILCFDSRLKLDRGSCGSLVCIAPAELFRDPLFLADLGRLGVIGPRHFSNTCAFFMRHLRRGHRAISQAVAPPTGPSVASYNNREFE